MMKGKIGIFMTVFFLSAVEAIYGRGIDDAMAYRERGVAFGEGSIWHQVSGWQQDMIWHKASITGQSVAFSPDGKMIAATMGFGEIGLFRVSDGSLIRTFEGHTGLVESVSFSPDGKMIASGSGDGLALWRVGAGIILPTYVDVWPGDTNNDGIVDERDVLPVGLYWMKKGPARDPRSTEWKAQRCKQWDPKEATYADANGDGIVDEREILVIGMNWMKRRAGTASPSSPLVHLEHKPSAKEIEAYRRMYRVLNDSGMREEGIEGLKEVLRPLISRGTSLSETGLGKIYPNPFRSPVHIPYFLERSGHISLKVYNSVRWLVTTIFEGYQREGVYEVIWDGEGLCHIHLRA